MKKPFYFPTSKKLETYWFHRLVYPLFIVFIALYVVWVTVLVFSRVPKYFRIITALTLPNGSSSVEWCDNSLERWRNIYGVKPEFEQYDYQYELSDSQEDLLLYLPKEKARTYANNLGGCFISNKSKSITAWFTGIDDERPSKIYGSGSPSEEMTILGLFLLGYLIIAIVPGMIYRYLLYIFFGNKMKKLLSSN